MPTPILKYLFACFHLVIIVIAATKVRYTYQKTKSYLKYFYPRSFNVDFSLTQKKFTIMALSALLTIVGSDFQSPTQFTAASPSFSRYKMTSTIVDYGDLSPTVTQPTGIVANGFISVQFHNGNQWTTGRFYTSQTGSQINTLVVA